MRKLYSRTNGTLHDAWRSKEMGDSMITWKCDVCGQKRPDDKISVNKADMSERFNLPKGTMQSNVKFCNDKPDCRNGAANIHWKRWK